MAFDSFAAFLAMGKHGVYVWTAYGVSFAIVFWNVIQPVLRRRQWLHEQQAARRRAERDAGEEGQDESDIQR